MFYVEIRKHRKFCKRIVVTKGESIIGRDPFSAIHIDDAQVSRRHAKLILDDTDLRIVDLGSSNGTFLNEQKVKESICNVGDIIRIADHTLCVEAEGKAKQVIDRLERATEGLKRIKGSKMTVIVFCVSVLLVLTLTRSSSRSSNELDSILDTADLYQKEGRYDLALAALKQASGQDSSNKQIFAKVRALEIEKELQELVGLLAEEDTTGLVQKEKAIMKLHEKYPDADELALWQSLLQDFLNKDEKAAQANPVQEATPASKENVRGKIANDRVKKGKSLLSAKTTSANNKQLAMNPTRSKGKKFDENKSKRAKSGNSVVLRKAKQKSARNQSGKIGSGNGQPLAKKLRLTQNQIEIAKKLYYEAYKLMAYKTKKRYAIALTAFKQVQIIAPDPTFEFYIKAHEKIRHLNAELNKL